MRVSPEQDGRSVKSLLKGEWGFSEDGISRLKRREGGVLLNGMPVYTVARVRAGDMLCARIDDPPNESGRIKPLALPLDIVYEDEDFLVINKPAGVAVHPARDPSEITLENAVVQYLGEKTTPHPVSRLDRGTTGLMTFAKSAYIHERMRRNQHTDAFVRVYLGVAIGRVLPRRGVIDRPIGFAPSSRYQRAATKDGQPAVTAYETLYCSDAFSLLKLTPQTGRTHQLRVHMAYLGYPLAGDWLYGAEERALIARPALHAAYLSFLHPLSNERIRLFAPLPADISALLPHMPALAMADFCLNKESAPQ